MSSEHSAGQPLLVVIAPAARQMDGESVRIAKDVLSGGTAVKVVMPESPAELDRVLAHRGRKRPVVIGDDRALQRVVQILHRQQELGADVLGLVPVGRTNTVALARAWGVPTEPVAAARAVLTGRERSLDLLVDDSGTVVLGGLRIPGRAAGRQHPARGGRAGAPAQRSGGSAVLRRADPDTAGPPRARKEWDGRSRSLIANIPAAVQGSAAAHGMSWWSLLTPAGLGRTARTVLRACSGAMPSLLLPGSLTLPNGHEHRFRVEADGSLLTDMDRPVRVVAVRLAALGGSRPAAGLPAPLDGALEVLVRPPASAGGALRVRAQTVTVAGRSFRYEADSELTGPVRSRTWTVLPAAWRLTVPD